MAKEAPRIDAEQARERLADGDDVLVCAYEDEQKCRSMLLSGALTRQELERRKASLDRSRSILLYCA